MRTRYNAKLTTLIIINAISLLIFMAMGSNILLLLSIGNIAISIWGKDNEKSARKNSSFLIMAIINFICFKWVSAGFFTALHVKLKQNSKFSNILNNINKSTEKKEKIDPQIRKVDILLKLGVAMVFIAGFVFATTGWYSLNSIIKIFIFLIVACLFIGLSKFCEEKIKIKSTIYLYWILGMAFILLIFFTVGYSSLFGNYFSLIGEGRLLYFGFCSLIFSVLSMISYYNFKDKVFLNLVYTGILLAVILLVENLKFAVEEIIILLVPIFTIIKLCKLDKEKDIYTLSIFSDIVIWILGVVFICFIGAYTNVLAVVALSILFIFNIYSYIYVNKEADLNVFASAISYVLLIPSFVLLLNNDSSAWVLATTFIVTFLYLVSLIFNNKKLKNSSLITADIITILVFLISTDGPVWLPLLVSLFSVLICVACTFIDRLDDYDFEISVHPIKVSMLLFGIIFLLNSYFGFSNVMGYWLSSTLLLYILIYSLSRKKAITNIYEKFSVGAVIISLLFTTAIPNLIVSVIIFVSIVLFYADVNWTKNCTSAFKNFVFGLLLLNILIGTHAIENSLMIHNVFEDINYFYANVISIVLFILVGIFHKNDEFKLNLSLFAVIIPIITMIETYVDIEWISIVLPSVFVYYLTFIISRLFKKNETAKSVVGYIGYSYAFLLVLFNTDYYVLAFTFILLIISLLLGYFDKSYNALFKVSVVALIIEILYQLKEFWNLIPAWLYLLFVGLALIIFATYKQLKIAEKDKGDKK